MKIRRYRRKIDFPVLFLKVALFLAILSLIFGFYAKSLRPMILSCAEKQAQRHVYAAIQKGVLRCLENSPSDYETFIRVSRDSLGHVTSLETDPVSVNRFKAAVTADVLNSVASLKKQELKIAAGSLCDIPFFWGRGPKLSFIIEPFGTVDASLVSEFSSAGVNQTCHRINLHLTVHFTAAVPGNRLASSLTSDFYIAETVIVGDVPQFFADLS